jgi:hypothetical protein
MWMSRDSTIDRIAVQELKARPAKLYRNGEFAVTSNQTPFAIMVVSSSGERSRGS